MPMQAQTRLLRALQSGTIRRVGGRDEVRLDVRIIAATNKDLKPQIAAGLFREDLYYRLNVVPIRCRRCASGPRTSRRWRGISSSWRRVKACRAAQLSEDAADLLSRQPWRGNVRELRNFIYRLALLARDNRIDAATVADMLESEPPDAATCRTCARISAARCGAGSKSSGHPPERSTMQLRSAGATACSPQS
jgi:two-component system nitrogen regulation response regulator GlnG